MRAKGNGTPEVCANNLIRILRGECPFERVKGINSRLIDSPSDTAQNNFEQDAGWMIDTYEPRVHFDGVDVSSGNENGDLHITARVTRLEE